MGIEIDKNNIPKSIGIIMDGNRRWARNLGKKDVDGHKEGAENIKRIARFANNLGIKYMTVFAFSTENWKRAEEEVSALMFLFKKYLTDLLEIDSNVRVRVIGRREGLDKDLIKAIEKAEEKTKDRDGMCLNVALNYGGRDEIVNTTKKIAQKVLDGKIEVSDIDEALFANNLYTAGQDDPDLLIRTSGEQRTSNFLPWQLTYSEFYFPNKHWPEFDEDCLLEAIAEYQKRNRKFGGNK